MSHKGYGSIRLSVPGPGGYVESQMCLECGAIVLNETLHTEFHAALEDTKRRADYGYGMTHPIGGPGLFE